MLPGPIVRALRKLGDEISVARRVRRMTQEDLAQRVGTSVTTIGRLEAGDPGTALQTFLGALHVLGRLDAVTGGLAHVQDELGQDLARQQLPQRVRGVARSSRRERAQTPGATPARAPRTTDKDELEGF